jgi:hypothetical protein
VNPAQELSPALISVNVGARSSKEQDVLEFNRLCMVMFGVLLFLLLLCRYNSFIGKLFNPGSPGFLLGTLLAVIHFLVVVRLLIFYPYTDYGNGMIFIFIDFPISLLWLIISLTQIPMLLGINFNNYTFPVLFFGVIGTLWYFWCTQLILTLFSCNKGNQKPVQSKEKNL